MKGSSASSELIVDSFAGGGGASLGIEMALGRSPDIAINHDPEALAMHAANHPATLHLPHNVWKVDPVGVTRGRPVGLLWASPDCKHHSKAKGGKPVKREIRDLAWVVVRWARQVRPRLILLENVEEFRDWGPLDLEGRPCKERKGQTFDAFVGELRRLGYRVDWRELRACDFGAPTIRKRLFLVARRDGRAIVWPEPTHGAPGSPEVLAGARAPWRTAAEIIDWSIPCPSIFLSREEGRAIGVNRPLAPNTMARIAKGVKRYVLDVAEPFIVPVTHAGDARVHGIDEPLRTVTTAQRGEHALVAPFLVPRYGERPGQEPRTRSVEEPIATVVPTQNGGSLAAVHLSRQFGASVGSAADEPVGTVTAGGGGKTAVVAAYLAQHNGDGHIGREAAAPLSTLTTSGRQQAVVAAFLAQHNTGNVGRDASEPLSTIVHRGTQQAIVAGFLSNLYGSNDGSGGDLQDPARTVTAGGSHAAEVRAFLVKYYGSDQDPRLGEPLHTVTTKDRFGLVEVRGELYAIDDIGMRMLTPRELFRAQGFPDSYRIEMGMTADGPIALTKTAQIRMCGNSVSPVVARALVAANYAPDELASPVGARRKVDLPLLEGAA
ncbi:DNA cytosine methyltransferase [Methylosinus sp. Ce-a6]|uniref:DNA cytosine methyltransferase n=1 Tax=Methylosinus sp. Ce-a6 TaxID=2172005 RepID=UPI00135CA55D|nr:DNA cytosine methyltransferase [Methylosinus sp. Ce-a6]